MKKSKLIELLSKIEGNPDIMLWNGYAGDYQDIDTSMVEQSLSRMKFESYVNFVYCERRDKNGQSYVIPETEIPTLKKSYSKHIGWELNHVVSLDKNYKSKKVYLMQPKLRGKQEYMRGSGALEY